MKNKKNKTPYYDLKPQNATALIAPGLRKAWDLSCERAGMNNTQAMIVTLTLMYADPKTRRIDPVPDGYGRKPVSPNYHVRLPGIVGTWLEEIQHDSDIERTNRSATAPRTTSKAEVFEAAMIYFIEIADSGSLMSTMGVIR